MKNNNKYNNKYSNIHTQYTLHIGPSKCKWGSIEWCASPVNATRCKKTNYCLKFKWFTPNVRPSLSISSSFSSKSKNVSSFGKSKVMIFFFLIKKWYIS